MLGKLFGGYVGQRIAGRNSGARGAILGALAPSIARRAFGPLGLALGAGYLGKKWYDSRKARRAGSAGI